MHVLILSLWPVGFAGPIICCRSISKRRKGNAALRRASNIEGVKYLALALEAKQLPRKGVYLEVLPRMRDE